jgi:hypothetical protein
MIDPAQVFFIASIGCFAAAILTAALKGELDWKAAGLFLFAIAIYLA